MNNKLEMLDYELNLRSALTAYMIGADGEDICEVMTMIEVEGDPTFETSFHCHLDFIHAIIIRRCRAIVHEALLEAMLLTYGGK